MDTVLFDKFFEVEDRHWWFVGRRKIVLDQLAQHGPFKRILDLGCGTGGVLAHLDPLGWSVGIDPSEEARHYCRERGVPMAQASGADLPFADQTFDGMLALDVIEHVEDDVALLREARRVLTPDGVLIVTVPALPWLWSDHDVVNQHYRRYVRSTLRRSLCAAGLEPVKVSYYNAFLLPLAVLRKVAHRVNGGGEHHLETVPGPANGVLQGVLTAERPLIRRVDLPVGASLICAARRVD